MSQKVIVTFGEIMGRFAPEGFLRFRQALPGPLDLTFGGAEANVAASLAIFGAPARFVTALPKHAIADACVGVLSGLGVDTTRIVRTGKGRLGLYFLETGANQRPSNVIYDRSHSSVSLTAGSDYNWTEIFSGAGWLHTTGITPALSEISAGAVLSAVQAAKSSGLQVSCDLNFRKKLWGWSPGTEPGALAEKTMRSILPYVDVVIANEEDAADVLGIHAAETDVHSGKVSAEKYPDVARQIAKQFPNVSLVAITLRESLSASHNNWGAMLYDVAADTAHFAPVRGGEYLPWPIKNIVDRVGGGDSFGAGLIFALNTPELAAPEKAVAFAVAASCLAHSIVGDINYSTRAEVESLMGGSGAGRVVR
jgi:2-dehydro-3-deoxygluconokinase